MTLSSDETRSYWILADYLIESIDESVNPCENFFDFVCGTWVNNTRIPDDGKTVLSYQILVQEIFFSWSAEYLQSFTQPTRLQCRWYDYSFSIELNSFIPFFIDLLSQPLSDQAAQVKALVNTQNLYRSCINETAIDAEGVNTILSVVDAEFGGWPILQRSPWKNESFDLMRLLLKIRKYNQNLLFRVITATDEKNSTAYDIEVRYLSIVAPPKRSREFILNISLAGSRDSRIGE